MRCSTAVALLWLAAHAWLGARATSAADDCDGELVCEPGCYNPQNESCVAGFNATQCTAENSAYEWVDGRCNCECRRLICNIGCYDQEDERCHDGLTEMQCAEIYGHVEWSARCSCRYEGGDYIDNGTATTERTSVNLYFSIPAFVVLFRESLEVVIVLVVILQFLAKTRDQGMITQEMFIRFRREVYLGAGLGFACCLVIGVGFLVLASLVYGLFKGDNRRIFEGTMMMITCAVLAFLALNFYKMVHTMQGHERKMKKKVEEVLATSADAETLGVRASFNKRHAFLVFAFSVGLREGLESIIFLVGVVSDVKDLSSLPLPIVTAIVLARLVGCCFFQGTKKVNVAWFMRGSAILLMFIAAGFWTSSMHMWQELGLFGTWSPRAERPWQNQAVFDARDCCNDKTNRFFVLVRALFGYQDQPTPVEFMMYAVFWAMALTIGFFIVRRAKRQLQELIQKWQKMDEEDAEVQARKNLTEEANSGGLTPEVIGDIEPSSPTSPTEGEAKATI